MAMVFMVGDPNSEADLGVRYTEHVPTHVQTLDTKLQWLAEEEMRNVADTNPHGSRRTLEFVRRSIIRIGSTPVYDTEFMLNYRRTSARGKA